MFFSAALYLLLAVVQLPVHERLLLLLPGVPPLRDGFLLLQPSTRQMLTEALFHAHLQSQQGTKFVGEDTFARGTLWASATLVLPKLTMTARP